VGDPSSQVHDFNPGIAPNGLFWTMPVTRSAIEVDPGRGTARFRAENLPVPDYHDIINAIFGGSPPVPGHVSFDVSWAGGGDRQDQRDTTYNFVGQYRTSPATINFSVKDDTGNVVFTSDADGQTNSLPPEVGHERNGVFFS
jgi:hypothetical protein